jgi:hypothetical protein
MGKIKVVGVIAGLPPEEIETTEKKFNKAIDCLKKDSRVELVECMECKKLVIIHPKDWPPIYIFLKLKKGCENGRKCKSKF